MHTRTHSAALTLLAILSASPASFAANVAGTATGGRGICGINNTASLGAFGISLEHTGTVANINDNVLTTRVDTFGSTAGTYSFAGIRWPYRRADVVGQVTFTIACFGDGGWFGFSGIGPAANSALSPSLHVLPPYVQITTDGGTTWTAVDSDAETIYHTAMDNFLIGGSSGPTSKSFTISLTTPVSGINGIRVIGENGGIADGNGFLGVFEVAVDATLGADTDSDGMSDVWETAHGLNVGVNDAAGDPDTDTLTNLQEFQNHADPQSADTDADGLTDSAEVSIHLTYPGGADSDWDGLTDGAEVNTHSTNPRLTDSDGDGLADGAEVNTHNTNPANADTDGDQFPDGLEIARSFNPLSNTSRPLNIAMAAAGGAATCGVSTAINGGTETVFSQDGNTQAIFNRLIDEDATSRIQTFSASVQGNFSFAGVTWTTARALPVEAVELTMACFGDGGWFGRTFNRPALTTALRVLAADNLPLPEDMPVVQIKTTTEPAWTTVPSTTNYSTEAGMLNHPLAGSGPVAITNGATARTVVFKLNTPASNVTGVRIIGKEGGTAGGPVPVAPATEPDGRGFMAAYELVVKDSFGTNQWDFDADGRTDAAELAAGTDPSDRDSDDDGFLDGIEVVRGTDPSSASSRPSNIALAGVAMSGVNDGADTDNGTSVTNAQQPTPPPAPFALALLASNNVNDGNFGSRVDTFSTAGSFSYVGIRWPALWPQPVSRVELTMATFYDGGWFGVNSSSPGEGQALTATQINEANQPVIQVSTDGITWTSTLPGGAAVTTDFVTKMIGHAIGNRQVLNPTRSPRCIFTIDPPIPAGTIKAIRLIGREGGTASAGFLGIFELGVQDTTTSNDLDQDGLLNSQEATLGTNPEDDDSDDDGLLDGAEVNTHSTNPLLTDTDGDHFNDRLEVSAGSSPLQATFFPDNVALLGTAIIGVSPVIDTTLGTPTFQAGVPANINDGNPTTKVDTWNNSGGVNSYAGILWPATQTVKTLTMTFATFYDGGWFGPNGVGPGDGGALAPEHLAEPVVQVTTDGGVTWGAVEHTSDYLTVFNGHLIGNTAAVNPTSKTATFTLDTAVAVNGVRIIGAEGGQASGGFLGCWELAVGQGPVAGDADNDDLPDAWEIANFGYVHAQHLRMDTDGDGSDNLLEYGFGMNPALADQPPAGVAEGGFLTMTITKKPGVVYTVLSGSELTDFSAADTTVLVDDATTLKVRDNVPLATGPRRFLKTTVMPAP